MGQPKKINFNYKKWKKYGDKVIFIKVNDLPIIKKIKEKKDYQLLKIQMEKLFLGIKNASNEDIIIFSDEDEIPNPMDIAGRYYTDYDGGLVDMPGNEELHYSSADYYNNLYLMYSRLLKKMVN
jgi:hypothetical protein